MSGGINQYNSVQPTIDYCISSHITRTCLSFLEASKPNGVLYMNRWFLKPHKSIFTGHRFQQLPAPRYWAGTSSLETGSRFFSPLKIPFDWLYHIRYLPLIMVAKTVFFFVFLKIRFGLTGFQKSPIHVRVCYLRMKVHFFLHVKWLVWDTSHVNAPFPMESFCLPTCMP